MERRNTKRRNTKRRNTRRLRWVATVPEIAFGEPER
jgi:hypothetical protein